ncbi:MAG: Ligand-binding SRPBCC domain protein family [uncultured Solirubrobacteraceae bacterium]|uniref:Ligand-binding SRPBCC domain protein family n=1 Tax=uncultured Solirubrobacteraceae bacterium TaxID=1162706 RepID=A0A6J4S253_9ACTN|nr:MAG: Ligand-binding SRPBCC domain protein family [uncultured Solirubrobacteraceae bacterium]
MAATSSGTARVTLPAPEQILIEREFAAPARLVWRAVTEPELVRRWWHAGRGEMTACEIDLRVGGRWRYAMRPEGGDEFAFYGEFLEIVPDERIVQTETFAPFPDDPSTNTMTLTERDGVTVLRTLVRHGTPEARDMHINSGMEAGMQDAFDRLEQVAVSLA